MAAKYTSAVLTLGTIVFIGLVGLMLYKGQNKAPIAETSPLPQSTARTIVPKKEITLALFAQNNSGQTGSVNISEENNSLKFSVNIKAGPPGLPQPAHIHKGNCTNLGAIQFPLVSVINGFSQTTVSTTFQNLQTISPLAINVHKSTAQLNTYVSCANLDLRSITGESSPSSSQ